MTTTTTVEQEIALGKQAAPEMEQQFGGLSQDQALQSKVTDLGNPIVKGSDADQEGIPQRRTR